MSFTLIWFSFHLFQLTAARRRLAKSALVVCEQIGFNSQPPEGGWAAQQRLGGVYVEFQLTAARRRLGVAAILPHFINQFQLTAARRRLVPPLKPLPNKACIALFR